MPIYEYKCDKCGVFEVTQRITENPLKKCLTCKGKVERIISATSFVLKGTGWYATDYARSGTSKSEDSSGSAKSDSNGTSSSESSSNGSSSSTSSSEAAKSSADKSADKAGKPAAKSD